MHIYALTESGFKLAKHIQSVWPAPADVFYQTGNFKDAVQASFKQKIPLVLICATGIAVRVLADVLVDKTQDPPVLVLDEFGQYVIPLLSGHEGGANDLALKLSQAIKATCVITTANSYTQPIYTLGVGCERDCPLSFLEAIIDEALTAANLTLADIVSINSIDIKADEVAMLAYAKKHQLAFNTYDKTQLRTVESQLSQRSAYILKTVGVYGVAESAALLAAKKQTKNAAELILPKIKNTKATCAIARSYPFDSKTFKT